MKFTDKLKRKTWELRGKSIGAGLASTTPCPNIDEKNKSDGRHWFIGSLDCQKCKDFHGVINYNRAETSEFITILCSWSKE